MSGATTKSRERSKPLHVSHVQVKKELIPQKVGPRFALFTHFSSHFPKTFPSCTRTELTSFPKSILLGPRHEISEKGLARVSLFLAFQVLSGGDARA